MGQEEDRLWIEGNGRVMVPSGTFGGPHIGDLGSGLSCHWKTSSTPLGLSFWLSPAFSSFSDASAVCCQRT